MGLDILRFTDPADDSVIRLDIGSYIDATSIPSFPVPPLSRSTAETFLRAGAAVGQTHHSLREITIPLVLSAASKQLVIDKFRDVVKEVERASSLEVRLDGGSTSVFFDLVRSEAEWMYNPIELRGKTARVQARLTAQPYARGAELTATSTWNPNNWSATTLTNFVDLAAPTGDVEAPTTGTVSLTTTPANRLIARLYRRTDQTETNYKSIYHASDAVTPLESNVTSEGTGDDVRLRYAPPNQSMNLIAKWTEGTNTIDKTGLVHVYARLSDNASGTGTGTGKIKMRMDLRYFSGAEEQKGQTYPITFDDNHLSSQDEELWFLGAYRIPTNPRPSSWNWRLHAQRTSGTADIKVWYVVVVPVDESAMIIDFKADSDISGETVLDWSWDTEQGKAWWGTSSSFKAPAALLGRGLFLKPGEANRIIQQTSADGHTNIDDPPHIKHDNLANITIKYKPRFLFVR